MACLDTTRNGCPIVGDSEVISNARNIALKAAKTPFSVLILGERGTGKELFAQFIHNNSSRASKPFIAVNCAGIASSLIESEFFGIVKNTASGVSARPGYFEAAHGGTLFLDEIGDMPSTVQAMLLRALQEKEVIRVGERTPRPFDVRIISATNKDIKKVVSDGTFRGDLYDRLNEVKVTIPPLRERLEDIPDIAEHILRSISDSKRYFSSAALKKITGAVHDWPGNVRELRNVIISAHTESLNKKAIDADDICIEAPDESADVSKDVPEKDDLDVRKHVSALLRSLIDEALKICDGNQGEAAKMLGLSRYHVSSVLRGNGISAQFVAKSIRNDSHVPRFKKKSLAPSLTLDENERKAIDFLKKEGPVGNKKVREHLGKSHTTVCKILKRLVNCGVLEISGGKGNRDTRYFISDGT